MTALHHRAVALEPPALRRLRFEDYPAVERLEASEGLLTLPEADWRSLWLENPLWPALGDRWPIGWVLEHRGAIVGALTNVPSRYVFRGRTLIAANGRAWVVSPEYRALAPWLLHEFFEQESADLHVNTTVNGLAAEAFCALGSTRVPAGDWEHAAYRITDHARFAAAALRIKGVPRPLARRLGPPAGALLRARERLCAPPLPDAPAGFSLDWPDGFDGRFDAFWAALVARSPEKLLGGRTRAELAWHFGASLRDGRAWVGTLRRGEELRAYGVFKRQDHPPSGLTRMRLVDYQSLEPGPDLLPGLVAAAARRCASGRIGALEHVGCGLPRMGAFDRLAPYRRALPAWPYYYKASDPVLRDALADPDAWDPSSFDGDASL